MTNLVYNVIQPLWLSLYDTCFIQSMTLQARNPNKSLPSCGYMCTKVSWFKK